MHYPASRLVTVHSSKGLLSRSGASCNCHKQASDLEAGRAVECRTTFIDLGYTNELKRDNASSIELAANAILAAAPYSASQSKLLG